MRKELFDIKGMSCSACSARIEKVVGKMKGVASINVNLLKNNAHIAYDEAIVDEASIIAKSLALVLLLMLRKLKFRLLLWIWRRRKWQS